MGIEHVAENPEELPGSDSAEAFLSLISTAINDGTIKHEIDEATGYDPELSI